MLFNFREDVVAGAVENPVERRNAITRDALAQNRVDRNAAGHARFHGEVDAGRDGAIPDLRAARGHQFLIRRDYRFAVLGGGVDNLARYRGAAHQLGNDIDLRMLDDLAPIRSLQNLAGGLRNFPGCYAAAAYGFDTQRKPKLERDLLGVFGKNRERTAADVAQADQADVHCIHRYCFRCDVNNADTAPCASARTAMRPTPSTVMGGM